MKTLGILLTFGMLVGCFYVRDNFKGSSSYVIDKKNTFCSIGFWICSVWVVWTICRAIYTNMLVDMNEYVRVVGTTGGGFGRKGLYGMANLISLCMVGSIGWEYIKEGFSFYKLQTILAVLFFIVGIGLLRYFFVRQFPGEYSGLIFVAFPAVLMGLCFLRIKNSLL